MLSNRHAWLTYSSTFVALFSWQGSFLCYFYFEFLSYVLTPCFDVSQVKVYGAMGGHWLLISFFSHWRSGNTHSPDLLLFLLQTICPFLINSYIRRKDLAVSTQSSRWDPPGRRLFMVNSSKQIDWRTCVILVSSSSVELADLVQQTKLLNQRRNDSDMGRSAYLFTIPS